MPVIRISDANYKWLQSQATPFEDTPDDVITRLRKEREVTSSVVQPVTNKPNHDGTRNIDPMRTEDLTHTRVLSARVGDINLAEHEWSAIVKTLHRIGLQRLGSFEQLQAATIARIVKGKRTDSGYKHLPDINISIQNMDATSCWRSAFHLARKLNIPIEVVFQWRTTEKAAYPGEVARISWSPNK